MRHLLTSACVALLAISVAACGDADSSPTTTPSPEPDATATATTPASTAERPLPSTRTPEPDTPTTTPEAPAVTRTPRPPAPSLTPSRTAAPSATETIAATATPQPTATATTEVVPTATDVPTATETVPPPGGLLVVVDEEFDNPAVTQFYTGEANVATLSIADGVYRIRLREEGWQTSWAANHAFSDGAIEARAFLQGDGVVGIAARIVDAGDGSGGVTFEMCWLDPQGAAGCRIERPSGSTELFATQPGAVVVDSTNGNVLSIRVDDGLLSFYVDGNLIGEAPIEPANGPWGMYGESNAGEVTATFEYVRIALEA